MGRETFELFARCAAGFEDVLADELRSLRLGRVRPQVGGVSFSAQLEGAYRACLWSRVATRIQLVIARVRAETADELYQGVYELSWEDHVREGATIAVDAHGANDELKNTAFVALKVKDAICDRLRERRQARPDVDPKDPDLSINVAIHPKKATIYINLSGSSLHRRGYRADGVQSAAPLKETLAAGMLLAAGWQDLAREGAAFVDPMCGSGTLAIEAALIAAGVAPGFLRERWGFEGWSGHDEKVWRKVKERGQAASAHLSSPIYAADIDEAVLALARDNARRAQVLELIRFQRADAANLKRNLKGVLKGSSVQKGLMATNPPYEERLKTEGGLLRVRETLVAATDALPAGWKVALISPDTALDTCLGRIPDGIINCYNGAIEVSIRLYTNDAAGLNAIELVSLGGRQHKIRVADSSSEQFAARLRKVARERTRWARREQVGTIRIYDADLPDFALTVDLYEGRCGSDELRLALVEEYPRPQRIDAVRSTRRLEDACAIVSAILEIDVANVLVRPWPKGAKKPQRKVEGQRLITVRESGLSYGIDLNGKPDTGLPLAARGLRSHIEKSARGKRVLVLGGMASACVVSAVKGLAKSVTLVEPFSDRIDFIRRTIRQNGLSTKGVQLVEQDMLGWLKRGERMRFDLVVLAPPAWIPRAKGATSDFELAHDYSRLIGRVLTCVEAEGELIFYARERNFHVDVALLKGLANQVDDISAEVTDIDFSRTRVPAVALRLKP